MSFTASIRMASLAAALALFAIGVQAEVKTNNLFSDNMVLQRGEAIPVWGTASPGEKITVQLDRNRRSTTADDNGDWMVELRKMDAGGPYVMTITGENTITYNNVMIGEVWVCSGQSNMQWTVSNSKDPDYEISRAFHPNIRLFYVPRVVTSQPRDNVDASWEVCTPETIPGFSAVAYYFGRELSQQLNIPIGLIHTSWGGTPAEAWTKREHLEDLPIVKNILDNERNQLAALEQTYAELEEKYMDWKARAERAEMNGEPVPSAPQPPRDFRQNPHRPSGLFNAMIAPLIPYAIEGAIWYQGESNASRAYQYRELFPTMIQSWRDSWGQGEFPFYFVQLANFEARWGGVDVWPELREAQLMTLSLPNTGMAVTTDIGNPSDIHPKNKQEVGRRLALIALANDYGKDIVYSGPIYKSMEIEGDSIRLMFDHIGHGLAMLGGELRGFTIAGDDKEFHPATAVIEDDTIVVSSDEVSNPVAVRYAWKDNPEEANLYNADGLPASPFRTDDWPGLTVDNR